MAGLTHEEKAELLRIMSGGLLDSTLVAEPTATAHGVVRLPRRLTPLECAEFATFASLFDRSTKPVAFEGEHWKF